MKLCAFASANEKCTSVEVTLELVELVICCCFSQLERNPQFGIMSDTHNSKAGCGGFILVLSGNFSA